MGHRARPVPFALCSTLLLGCVRHAESEPPESPPPLRTAAAVPTSTPAPAPPEAPPPTPPKVARFGWVLPLDNGVRADSAGEGWWLAPRSHGKHNGIDLLAPVGTNVLSPCPGKMEAGKNPSHGVWAHVVCELPSELGAKPGAFVSFFFAHLREASAPAGETRDVGSGEVIGTVGKTGNASGASVAPHLHLEALVQDSEAAALADRHSGRDHSETAASREVSELIQSRCELSRSSAALWRGRRVDPFVLLSCLGSAVPDYQRPPGKLAEASFPWSTRYTLSATRAP